MQNAKTVLQNKAEHKRALASLTYSLNQQGIKNAYQALGKEARRKWFEAWFANRLAEKPCKTTVGGRSVEYVKKLIKENEWMSKEQIMKVKGDHKGAALIESGIMEHRPCLVTGLDGEWTREYHVGSHKSTDVEREGKKRTFTQTTDETEEDAGEALKNFQSAADNYAGNRPIKLEPGSEPVAKNPASSSVDGQGAMFTLEKHTKTMEALNKDLSTALFALS